MKQVDTKKLVLGCLVIMILMIVYTKVTTSSEIKKEAVETAVEKSENKKPQSLLLSDRLSGFADVGTAADPGYASADGNDEETPADQTEDEEQILGPAEKMDVERARKESYGLVVELDYVSENRISLHGKFGYMVFSLENTEDGSLSASLERAVTFEELGGLTMGGTAYTDVLGGDGCALIVPGIHNEEIARRRKFLYIEETNEITGGVVAPAWMMKKMADHDYSDAVTETEFTQELTGLLRAEGANKLLYGPVIVPEYNSNTYGFLAESGEKLEDIWYGLWNRDLGTIMKVKLFE